MLTRILTGTARVAVTSGLQAPQRFASSTSSQLATSCLEGTGNQFSQVKAGDWQSARFKAETGGATYPALKIFGG